jgi:hypothetical protein
MNALRPLTFVPATHDRTPRPPMPSRPTARRERDFGVGYGRSSGYASPRRYATQWAPPRFRFV